MEVESAVKVNYVETQQVKVCTIFSK